jgi:hypothetical protein
MKLFTKRYAVKIILTIETDGGPNVKLKELKYLTSMKRMPDRKDVC